MNAALAVEQATVASTHKSVVDIFLVSHSLS